MWSPETRKARISTRHSRSWGANRTSISMESPGGSTEPSTCRIARTGIAAETFVAAATSPRRVQIARRMGVNSDEVAKGMNAGWEGSEADPSLGASPDASRHGDGISFEKDPSDTWAPDAARADRVRHHCDCIPRALSGAGINEDCRSLWTPLGWFCKPPRARRYGRVIHLVTFSRSKGERLQTDASRLDAVFWRQLRLISQ
jgi:hypothetical protein